MTRFVLVSDSTLSYSYRDFPLLDFLSCSPSRLIPSPVYKFLKGKEPQYGPRGELTYAPYSLRRLEVSLRTSFNAEDVVVAQENHLAESVDSDTSIIAVSTMDPFGLGPTTMSYYALFGGDLYAWVWKEWDALMEKINRIREGTNAKLLVGGPGVWEFTILRDEMEKYGIDYVFQGEVDDVAVPLFQQIEDDSIDSRMFVRGYMGYDDNFKKTITRDEKFLARGTSFMAYPKVEDIKPIVNPSVKGLVEVMRGCGVGCDFCEVTLRPLRYYPIENIKKEIEVNVRSGQDTAWLQSDEIWGYKHGPMFEPNEEELSNLFGEVMSVKGVKTSNPTHGRISIPAAHPEMIEKFTKILRGGPDNWIGIQTGVETGSDILAAKHMPNKTLPLRIGPDGSWQEIVWEGVSVETKNFWRPAFTIQVGQEGETEDDLMDTVALINRLSNSYSAGRPFEFTVTPLLNVPLGRLKSRELNIGMLSKEQLAVYYAAYRHLAKMAWRDGFINARGNIFSKTAIGSIISFGGSLMLHTVEKAARKAGVDIDAVKRHGLDNRAEITSLAALSRA